MPFYKVLIHCLSECRYVLSDNKVSCYSVNPEFERWNACYTELFKQFFVFKDVDLSEDNVWVIILKLLECFSNILARLACIILEVENEGSTISFLEHLCKSISTFRQFLDGGLVNSFIVFGFDNLFLLDSCWLSLFSFCPWDMRILNNDELNCFTEIVLDLNDRSIVNIHLGDLEVFWRINDGDFVVIGNHRLFKKFDDRFGCRQLINQIYVLLGLDNLNGVNELVNVDLGVKKDSVDNWLHDVVDDVFGLVLANKISENIVKLSLLDDVIADIHD